MESDIKGGGARNRALAKAVTGPRLVAAQYAQRAEQAEMHGHPVADPMDVMHDGNARYVLRPSVASAASHPTCRYVGAAPPPATVQYEHVSMHDRVFPGKCPVCKSGARWADWCIWTPRNVCGAWKCENESCNAESACSCIINIP